MLSTNIKNSKIEESNKDEPSLLTSYSAKTMYFDPTEKKMGYNLTVKLKEYKDSMKVNFIYYYGDSEELTIIGEKGKGSTFSAIITIPVSSSFSYGIRLKDGEMIREEMIEHDLSDIPY